MNDQINQNQELSSVLKQQYDNLPYPQIPIEKSPDGLYNSLFIHNLVTSYYLYKQQIIDTNNKIILDAGCGSGWKSLVLAKANPGAKVVGIDLSPESVKIAQHRLNYHGYNNAEFYAIEIEQLGQLGYQFDYINCDEVIYLLPSPSEGLQALKSVLKPEGIIRINFHSYYQRFHFLKAQKLFQLMGLFESNPEEMEVEIVLETMQSLKDKTDLKKNTWLNNFSSFNLGSDKCQESVLMNYLLQGDKAYTIPEIFQLLGQTELEFLSMVNWRHWNVRELFNDQNNLPAIWEMGLENISVEESLHIYELLNPVHRLLDFWCVNAQSSPDTIQPLSTWTREDWQKSKVYLHPQLKCAKIKEDLINSLQNQQSFVISTYIPLPTINSVELETNVAACLLNLWEGEKTMAELVDFWLKIQPLDLITCQPLTEKQAWHQVIKTIIKLENFLYVLVEKSAK